MQDMATTYGDYMFMDSAKKTKKDNKPETVEVLAFIAREDEVMAVCLHSHDNNVLKVHYLSELRRV